MLEQLMDIEFNTDGNSFYMKWVKHSVAFFSVFFGFIELIIIWVTFFLQNLKRVYHVLHQRQS